MLQTLSSWRILALALSIWIFVDAFKQKRFISGALWAVASYFLPILGFVYWTFGRNTHIHTFRPSSSSQSTQNAKKLCSKCGTENTGTHCASCGNKLQM